MAEPPAGRPLRDATRAVHAGLPAAADGRPFLPGPTFAAPFHLSGDPANSDYVYGRYGNPTWTAYEQAIGALEGGEAVVFASGQAAVAAVMMPLLRPGDVLVVPSDGYFTVRKLANEHLGERGVEVREVPTPGPGWREAIEGATLVWLETPSNPGLDVCDVAGLCQAVHAAGGLVAVDNTLATPLGQLPLTLGADYSMAADTKAMSGHSDLLMGHVAVRDPARAEALRSFRTLTGALAGPFEAWLAHRSLATLAVRLERQCETAGALARALAERPDVEAVRYPGLPSDPAHALASRQMSRFGPVLTFTLAGRERAERFLAACELIAEATSFGGVHSTAERRARWGSDAVPEGLIRLSVGCEDADDLLTDVARALDEAVG